MATKYKRGRSWYLQYTETLPDGTKKQRRTSLGACTEAEAEAEKQRHERTGIPAAGPLFLDWAVTYATWHSKEYPDSYFRVEQILRCHLMPYFGSHPLMGITRQMVESYKHIRAEQVKTGTVTKELRTLQAMMNLAELWEVIPRNPIKGVKAPREMNARPPRWFSAEELKAIYQHSNYRHVWKFLANTGLRRSEAQAVRRSWITEDAIRVISTSQNRTKSAKWRVIPLTPGSRDALQHLGHDYILPQITPYSLSRAFSRDIKACGLEGSLHDLRHTYCSHLVMGGVPLRTVQILAGHSSFAVTERYAHLAPDYLIREGGGLEL